LPHFTNNACPPPEHAAPGGCAAILTPGHAARGSAAILTPDKIKHRALLQIKSPRFAGFYLRLWLLFIYYL
jgi:hypothetical protein